MGEGGGAWVREGGAWVREGGAARGGSLLVCVVSVIHETFTYLVANHCSQSVR